MNFTTFLDFVHSIVISTHRPAETPTRKSLTVTYLLWLLGGFFGVHHFYLNRDLQAFVWWSTIGGYFGVGWIVDMFRIPAMVREANEEPAHMERLAQQWRTQSKPDFSTTRFVFSFLVSFLYAQLFILAIPQESFAGIDLGYYLHWFIPLVVAIGRLNCDIVVFVACVCVFNCSYEFIIYLSITRCLYGRKYWPATRNY